MRLVRPVNQHGDDVVDSGTAILAPVIRKAGLDDGLIIYHSPIRNATNREAHTRELEVAFRR